MQIKSFPEFNLDNRPNLRLLAWLRVMAILGQTAAVTYSTTYLELQLPASTLFLWISIYALINLLTFARLFTAQAIGHAEFLIQLFIDILILSMLLVYSGGGANPFVSLYLVPITISAITLPAAFTWLLTFSAIAFYSCIIWFISPMDAHAFHAEHFSLHAVGMWLGFIIGALLVSFFVVRMGKMIQLQQKTLMDQRTYAIENEQLVKLGTLAASTAHELGTPLGTMQLIVDELKTDTHAQHGTDYTDQLNLLSRQITRCKQALSVLSNSTGQPQAQSGRPLNTRQFMQELLSNWQQDRPDINLSIQWQSQGEGPSLIAELSLQQALRNILNNAADASPDSVICTIDWNDQQLEISIEDHGPGIPVLQKSKLGKMPVDSQHDGLGIGLFLSHSIIKSLGGSIKLANLQRGGLLTRITIPLTSLMTSVH